jgi:lipopolysaccharide transport system permease protein
MEHEEIQPAERLTIVEPVVGFSLPPLRELVRYRDLIEVLVRRDVSVRYRQSAVGIFWAVLQPILLAIVFTVFLGVLADVPSGRDVPYAVYAITGMVMWLFFAGGFTRVSDSMVNSVNLISKVYFPRIIIPLAASLSPVVDFAIGAVVAVGVTLLYGIVPPVQVVLIPLLVPVVVVLVLGFGIFLSAISVKYRDIAIVVPFVLQVGLFVTPIIYPFSLVPDRLQPLYAINPMVGVLELWRWMLFPSADWPGWIAAVPIVMGPVLTLAGAAFFRRAEASFADVI